MTSYIRTIMELIRLEFAYIACDRINIGRLQEFEWCGWDHFESCGIVDKSSSWSRWAIVAEEYSDTSTSKWLK